MSDKPLTWNGLRDLSKEHMERAFQELIDKLESADKRYDELKYTVQDIESDVESLDYDHGQAIGDIKARVAQLEAETNWQGVQTEAQLVEWESRIVSQLEQLPIKKRPDYYHSLANFLAGEDVARLKELFDEIKAKVEEKNRLMGRGGGQ